MAVHPLRPATDRRLGGPLPRQQANQTRIHRIPPEIFTPRHAPLCAYAVLAPISKCYPPVYGRLSTRYSPVRHWDISLPSENFRHIPPFDLHVLGTPPAFILSQDQTLDFKLPRNIRPLENPLFSPGLIRLRSACQNLPAFCCFLLRIRVNLLLSYPVQAFSGLSFFTASFRFSFRSLNYSFFFLLESSGLHCCLFVKVLCVLSDATSLFYHTVSVASRHFFFFLLFFHRTRFSAVEFYYILSNLICQQKFSCFLHFARFFLCVRQTKKRNLNHSRFFFAYMADKRRKRDLNPRAA